MSVDNFLRFRSLVGLRYEIEYVKDRPSRNVSRQLTKYAAEQLRRMKTLNSVSTLQKNNRALQRKLQDLS
jgi:hypothetical protein